MGIKHKSIFLFAILLAAMLILSSCKEDAFDRPVRIDLTVDNVCQDILTGKVKEMCIGKENCNAMCEPKGCNRFGLDYVNYTWNNSIQKCYCDCVEHNKIRKSLRLGRE